jgi:oligogalacturonide transport system permease protein
MLDSYMPFYMQALLGCYPFFIFMLIQFLRGIPRDLDESAYIDGCSEIGVLTKILLPLLKPALFSAALFQFMWTYNDYTNVLIYINSVKKYTLSLALRLSLEETREMLSKAGFSLTHSSKSDIVVEYCIMNHIYDIFEINQVLFKLDLQPLGY